MSKYFFLFFLFFSLFLFLNYNTDFADPDSFYHAKMAVLIKEGGVVKNFPYLEFTFLKDYYTDHHLLYHLFLVPFILFLDPLIGTKLAGIFFATLSLLVFHWLLKNFKIKGVFYYSLFLGLVNPFIFRINLAKAGVLALIVLFLGFYLLVDNLKKPTSLRYLLIFLLSFSYVWLHGSFPLLIILAVLVVLGGGLVELIVSQKSVGWSRFIFLKSSLKKLAFCLLGLISGLVFNPYFPQNLRFYWEQTIKIGLINYQDIIGVGAEWYPYQPKDLMIDAGPVFLLFLVAIILLLIIFISFYLIPLRRRNLVKDRFIDFKINRIIPLVVSFLFSTLFFLLTLKSRRNVEYLIPFMVLFAAFSIDYFLVSFKIGNLKEIYFKIFKKKKILVSFLTLYFVLSFSFLVIKDLTKTKEDLDGFSWFRWQKVSEWLKNNTPEGSLIFHSDWDDFPLLFYHNSHNHYLVGLDPTFMYEYDQNRYWEWVKITQGEERENLSSIIKNNFGADYVLVGKDHPEMDSTLRDNFYFVKLYEDDEAVVYSFLAF